MADVNEEIKKSNAKNLIGESFDDYVQTQIAVRQQKLGLGLQELDTVKFKNSNTSFVRLTSGVNVDQNVLKNTGLDTKYNSSELAKVYRLGSISGSLTKGIGYNDSSVYGFASNSSYGYVPMPGITSTDVKALNRGSLREAVIQIKCHNLEQFQIIDLLYLRLKYSILLEWGHSVYFDNKGTLVQSLHDLSSKFLEGKITQQKMLDLIREERIKSDGNYDAFFGLVTNFSWTLRPDGGYDVTMTARSTGDIIESLKINAKYYDKDSEINTDPFKNASSDPNAGFINKKENSSLHKVLAKIPTQVFPGKAYAHGVGDDLTNYTPMHSYNLEWISGLKANFHRITDVKNPGPYLTYNEVVTDQFVNLSENCYGGQYFMKLGTLCRIIESFLSIYDTSKSSTEKESKGNAPILKIDYNFDKNYCLTFPRHCSLDPKVCVIPVSEEIDSSAKSGFSRIQTDYKILNISRPSSYPIGLYGDQQNDVIQYKDSEIQKEIYNQFKSDIGIATTSTSVNAKDETYVVKDSLGNSDSSDYIENVKNYINKQDFIIDNSGGVSGGVKQISEEIKGNIDTVKGTGVKTQLDDGVEYIVQVTDKQLLGYAKVYQERFTNGSYTLFVERIDNQEYTLKIPGYVDKTYKAWPVYSQTVTTYKYVSFNKNYINKEGVGLYAGRLGKEFRSDKNGVGRHMHLYVNFNHIVKTLDNNINIETGALDLYKFLKELMKGIQNALGNVNNFEVIYNEEQNSYRIIDNTLVPGVTYASKTIAKFNPNILKPNYGSFVKNVGLTTKLSNNFATMTTVGAQANGNVVGENATMLSKWNDGLTDRIITNRNNVNGVINSNAASKYLANFNALIAFNTKVNNYDVEDNDISFFKNNITDLFKAELGQFTQDDTNQGIGFLPFDLELTMLGLSGPRIYETYTIDDTVLPDVYKNKIQFICTGVSHKISDGEWTTILNSICGPNYNDKPAKEMPSVNNLKVTSVSRVVNVTSLTQTQKDNLHILNSTLKKNGFNTIASRLAIAAVSGKETGLEPKGEDSYAGTSVDSIRAIFGSKVKDKSNSELEILKKNPKEFFNYVYRNESGNIAGSDDGYNFRGRGFNQITNRTNYQGITKFSGVDYINNPDKLNEIQGASNAAAWFFGDYSITSLNKFYKQLGGTGNFKDGTNVEAAIKAAAWVNAGVGRSIDNDVVQQSIANALAWKDILESLYNSDSTLQ
jgi:putative chitinase